MIVFGVAVSVCVFGAVSACAASSIGTELKMNIARTAHDFRMVSSLAETWMARTSICANSVQTPDPPCTQKPRAGITVCQVVSQLEYRSHNSKMILATWFTLRTISQETHVCRADSGKPAELPRRSSGLGHGGSPLLRFRWSR